MDEPKSIYDEYPYHIVIFKTRGRQPNDIKKNMNIVASRWIKRNITTKNTVAAYPRPPYTTDKTNNYIQALNSIPVPPPVDWCEYNGEL